MNVESSIDVRRPIERQEGIETSPNCKRAFCHAGMNLHIKILFCVVSRNIARSFAVAVAKVRQDGSAALFATRDVFTQQRHAWLHSHKKSNHLQSHARTIQAVSSHQNPDTCARFHRVFQAAWRCAHRAENETPNRVDAAAPASPRAYRKAESHVDCERLNRGR